MAEQPRQVSMFATAQAMYAEHGIATFPLRGKRPAIKGYNRLGDSLEVIPVLQFGVVAARRDWAQNHRDAAIRFARALGGAYAYMHDKANREDVASLAADSTGAPIEVIRAVLAFYYEPDRGMMPRHGEISMPGVAKVIELLGASGELKPPLPAADRFVDLQYLKAAGLE